MRALLLFLASLPVTAQFLRSPVSLVDRATLTAMFRAACQGAIVNGRCDANPIDGGKGSWTIDAVRFGHFLSATSEDAIVTTSGFAPRDWFPVGSLLLSKRGDRWEALGVYKVHLDIRACVALQASGNRDALLCQTKSRSVNVDYSTVAFVEADRDDLEVREFFIAADSTQRCEPGELPPTIQKAAIDNIALNGVRLSISAHLGALPYTPALQQACRDATAKKAGAGFPDPPTRPYVIEYVFDGSQFMPTPQTANAARLFESR